jgi:photosystem II stability/assembly factor-like uncharacterized protein
MLLSLYKLLFFLILSLNVQLLAAQDHLLMMESNEYSVEQVRENAEKYFDDRYKGKGSGYNHFKRWEYNAMRMMDTDGFLKSDFFYIKEWEKLNSEINRNSGLATRSSDFWIEHGPDYYSATTSWNPGVGRITGFYIHPDDENYILAGAESGGIWKSTDGGKSWEVLTDYFSNLAVESITMHPTHDSIVYFGSTLGRIYISNDSGENWTLLGTAGSSSVRRVLINPENPELMYACSQNSGIYRSVNAGQNWTKVANDERGYDIVFKPGDYNTIFASGNRFHKSTDGGATFNAYATGSGEFNLMSVVSPGAFQKSYFVVENDFSAGKVPLPFAPDSIQAKLVLYQDISGDLSEGCQQPSNGEQLAGNIAMIRRGNCFFVDKVMNAQNAGAMAVIIINNASGQAPIAMQGGNSDITIPAVMISKENGDYLAQLSQDYNIIVKLQNDESVINAMKLSPKVIGVSVDNPEIVYLLEGNQGRFSGFFKSEDAGESFRKLPHSVNYLGYNLDGGDTGGQSPRNMEIAVNPYNANEIHIGGINTWYSLDGGNSFSISSHWVPGQASGADIGYCHADINRLKFYYDKLYLGTDGGLFKTVNTTSVDQDYFDDLTTGMGIRHFYKIGVSQTDPVVVTGGSQDNGTSWFTPSLGWLDWLGADGMETFVDKNDPDVLYGTSQFGRLYRKNKDGSYASLPRPDDRTGNWVTPFEQDPVQPNTIYVGYEAVYKSTNSGLSWTQISQEFSEKLNNLKIAQSDNKVMYASLLGELYKTTTGGGTWQRLTGFAGNVNSIAIHPKDPNLVALATTSTNKVFVSRNGGASWQIYRKNLPNFSALCLIWQDDEHEGLYLGMNYGVYYINSSMDNWINFSANLPNVIINELEINYVENRIYAGTYGRGLWSSPLIALDPGNTSSLDPNSIFIYPNPAHDQFNVVIDRSSVGKNSIELFDINGKRWKKTIAEGDGEYKIDVSALREGTYFVRISNEKGKFTMKIEIFRP